MIQQTSWQEMDYYLYSRGPKKEESRWPYVFVYTVSQSICLSLQLRAYKRAICNFWIKLVLCLIKLSSSLFSMEFSILMTPKIKLRTWYLFSIKLTSKMDSELDPIPCLWINFWRKQKLVKLILMLSMRTESTKLIYSLKTNFITCNHNCFKTSTMSMSRLKSC